MVPPGVAGMLASATDGNHRPIVLPPKQSQARPVGTPAESEKRSPEKPLGQPSKQPDRRTRVDDPGPAHQLGYAERAGSQ